MVVDDEEKANILNTFFSTVFTVENEMLGEIPRNNENPILRVTNLTQEEVRNRLNKIKIDKSPGPDGIHPRVLRELSNVIDKPLFLIFSDSIATGSVPQDWRIANVVPIFKKGSKSEPGNYRPLEEWWLNAAYLDVRMPSQLNVNFGGAAPYLEHYWPPKIGTHLERASIATWHTLKFWDLIRSAADSQSSEWLVPSTLAEQLCSLIACITVNVTSALHIITDTEGSIRDSVLDPGRPLLMYRCSSCQRDGCRTHREKLAVHKARTSPLDMSQFRNLFNTCKIPGVTRDQISNFFKTESEGSCPSHLIVMCRGRLFSFEAVVDGQILTPPEILRQFSYIENICQNGQDGIGLSALTTEERTRWAMSREHLISLDPKNLSHLEQIQSSLFVQSIDDECPHGSPEDYSQITKMSLAGDPTIRWGDKSYNSIVYRNGVLGSNCDHAPYDAMVLVALCDYIDQNIKSCEGRWKGSSSVRDLPDPEELVFTVDQKIINDIASAKAQYHTQASDLQVANYAFTSFGKSLVKKKKLHPDTFVQLSLQLAFYKLHGRPGSCYETAMTRMFYHGRTETMRPCTVEAVNWCRSMLDPASTRAQRQDMMLKAFAKHNKMMNECQLGKGFDRHLLGLLLIAKEEGLAVPELYNDPAFTKSLFLYQWSPLPLIREINMRLRPYGSGVHIHFSNERSHVTAEQGNSCGTRRPWDGRGSARIAGSSGGGGNFVLSTSLIGYTNVHGAVVPMVKDGYGFFYRIRDDRFVVACSAWKSSPETDAEKLVRTVFQNFHDMVQLMVSAQL
ncbi:unnamed protein product [Ranitomeya imitator]|uniref:Choline/carnitine acyltransferase domain-containing protein n=1 Tax=Ranitomeya imitator TaxID=111125 RepID=A0ABN9MFT3_9NEOB|nr:unnamed protein product [Ranitomeya imitator]